jgi:hypothetical protein
MPRGQARWDGRARWLLDLVAAEGGTTQPTTLAHALIALDRDHGRGAGLPARTQRRLDAQPVGDRPGLALEADLSRCPSFLLDIGGVRLR